MHITANTSDEGIGIGDIDGDGRSDIIQGEHTGALRVVIFENHGGGRLVPHVIGSGRESHLGVLPHDFDGDGDLDVVSIAYNDDRQLHLWRNDNTTLVTSRAGTA